MKEFSLNGSWSCRLPDGKELEVPVPGCWDAYTEEKDIAQAVVYTRRFSVPKEGMRYRLRFGGVSYYCDVFLNGVMIGSHEGIWDTFCLDVTQALRNGENELRLEITKPGYREGDRFPLREVLSGFIPDVLCTFGGIWDDVTLEAAPICFVDAHHAESDCSGHGLLSCTLDLQESAQIALHAKIFAPDGKLVTEISQMQTWEAGSHETAMEFTIPSPLCWEPDAPSLYRYELRIEGDGQTETVSRRFGCREIRSQGTQILLNGRPIYAKGVLHWGCYDDVIIPNPSPETIREEIAGVKAYGLNMIKHCLYIPREEYFELADEMGVLLWVELPVWLPDPTPELEPRIRREFPRILRQLQGHPSLILVSLGCELDDKVSGGILEEMYHLAKDSTHTLVRDNSGSGECYGGLAVDFADFFDYHFYADLQNMENLMETFTPAWRGYRPWLYGEFCDSDTMRDLQEVRAKKGVAHLWWESGEESKNPISILKPDFRANLHDERMQASGIREDFQEIKQLSLDHAMVHRKVTLEQTRSFPAISGYNITSIRDVAIATSGLFDDLMQPKFPVELFRSFHADAMLLPAWDLTRIWINADRVMNRERYNFFGGEPYSLHVLLSNYGRVPAVCPRVSWRLTDGGRVLRQGEIESSKTVACGEVAEIVYLHTVLEETQEPRSLLLEVHASYEGGETANSWPVFVYPRPAKSALRLGVYDPCNLFATLDELYEVREFDGETVPEDVDAVVCSVLTPGIRAYLQKGGKAFCMQRGRGSIPTVPVAFWREGIIRSFPHPVLDGLKKTLWCDDLRYFSLSTDTALDTESAEKQGLHLAAPILRRYDCREWLRSDYLAEFSLGEGRMIASTLRFEGGMGKEPLFLRNNRLAQWLLDRILRTLCA